MSVTYFTGIFYEIQNELGTKFQEKHYAKAAEGKFKEYNIPYNKKSVLIKVYYNKKLLGQFYVDFIV